MLCLSRRKNESIRVSLANGENIEIVVMEVRRGQVRLGITAPAAIPVHRTEVAERIEREIGAREARHG